MSTNTLHIRFLGEFSVLYGQTPLTALHAERPQSLLAYLLLHAATPQTRRQIAFMLWPDSGESQARTNLRNLLHVLRQLLPQPDCFLSVDSQTLQWRPDAPYTLDVADFQQALADAQDADAGTALQHLKTAVSLYQGDLLPDLYDDWVLPLRETLRQAYQDTLRRIIGLLEQDGAYRSALSYAQRLLHFDPLDESAYVQAMRLHALSGDRAGVQRIYQLCVDTLLRELDVSPGAATKAAYQQFLRAESTQPAADTPVISAQPRRSSPLRQTWRTPPQPTHFVGREAELAQLAQMLADPRCRLVTIVGPGGVGKTRLALQSATGHVTVFMHGAVFVPLAPVNDAALIPAAIADALRFTASSLSVQRSELFDYLHDKELLLVLDNMEQLVEGVEILSQLLQEAGGVKILATSRQRLRLAEEWTFDLAGFPLPAPDGMAGNAAAGEAVSFFVQSAQRVDGRFQPDAADLAAIARICRLVAGMPLGLQLAASWVRVLSCAEIGEEIARNLDFLTSTQRDAPPRHRSMRAVFDYSWEQLSAEEQQALAALSLFRGGFSREAAQQVAGAGLPLLMALIDQSLLYRLESGRFDSHELLRQFAYGRLEANAVWLRRVQQQHAAYFAALAETARESLKGAELVATLARLDNEHDNMRVALQWTIQAGEVETGLRLAIGLWPFWWRRGHLQEGRQWMEALLARAEPGSAVSPLLLARAYQGAGVLARNQGDTGCARRYYEKSLALHRAYGNEAGIAAVLNSLGTVAMFAGDYAVAEAYFTEARTLHLAQQNIRGALGALNNLGIVAMYQGDLDWALTLHEENLTLARSLNDPGSIAGALGNLGDVLRYRGEYERAHRVLDESLALLRTLQNRQGMATTLYSLGRLALAENSPAHDYFVQSLHLFAEVGNYTSMAEVLEGLAVAAEKNEAYGRLARLLGAADRLRGAAEAPPPPVDRPANEAARQAARAALGEGAFAAASREGAQMRLEDLVAYAAAE